MTKKKIVDNPSAKEVLEGIKGMGILRELLKTIPGATEAFPDMESAFSRLEELKEKVSLLFIPDRFNELFCDRGWIAYESLNLDLMKEAIALAEQGRFEEAEEHLVEYYNEKNLHWLKSSDEVGPR